MREQVEVVFPNQSIQATQIKELEKRIKILEQQLNFIKKTRYLAMTGQLPPDDTD